VGDKRVELQADALGHRIGQVLSGIARPPDVLDVVLRLRRHLEQENKQNK
jgi:hypothetical protein